MPSAVFYDPNGAIHMVCGGTPDQATQAFFAANAPAGTTPMIIDDTHPATVRPAQWAVKNGQLVQKTQVSISLSGTSLSVAPATSTNSTIPVSTNPINTTVYVGGNPVSINNGVGTLTTTPPAHARIEVSPLDPNYYSPPTFA